ncbi:type II toxin-antitoxin system HicB family antitoxin [Acidithiobacillus albertensis]|uniref:type II toxin-antitoxin system HicB family antitoxin n=1 Tax=Acidithiobacillus albertensis TaxID=119978 RepID=UPI001C07BE5E|nr:hypothetical protein [Acidithiobacillus albertensis]MBU2741662.1 type II toxin-antitoxin system HicB family antitoxin [Acidithiobacillus albertensis]
MMIDFAGFSVRLFRYEAGNEWAAEVIGFPNSYISAGGETPEAAIAELRIAFALAVEDIAQEDMPVPVPEDFAIRSHSALRNGQ